MLLLSYCSVFKVQIWQILLHCGGSRHWSFLCLLSCSQESMVGLRGLEPPTSRLSGVRSNHLSYKPMSVFGDGRRSFVFRRPLVEMRRIELLTPCLQGRCSPSWATPPYWLHLLPGFLDSVDECWPFQMSFHCDAYFSFVRLIRSPGIRKNMVGLTRLELVTSRLSGVRSPSWAIGPNQQFQKRNRRIKQYEIIDVAENRTLCAPSWATSPSTWFSHQNHTCNSDDKRYYTIIFAIVKHVFHNYKKIWEEANFRLPIPAGYSKM